MKLKYIPNILSCIRIALVAVFICCFFHEYPNNLRTAVIIFLVAGLTDVIDGFLARRFKWISNLGKVLDPLADKLMQCTVLVCMTIKEIIPVWVVIPFILKEVLILSGGLFMIKKRSVVAVSNIYGKLTVVFFYAAVVFCIVGREYLAENPLVLYLICAMVLIVAMSALLNYIFAYFKTIKKSGKSGEEVDATEKTQAI